MQKASVGDLAGIADLNLLRMLHSLLHTRSVTRSGELLGLSQPAASRQMRKLRSALKDPLLVRATKGYVLTSLAETLGPPVGRALAAADEVFLAAPLSRTPQPAFFAFALQTMDRSQWLHRLQHT